MKRHEKREPLLLRSFYLRLWQRLWRVPVYSLAGAFLALSIYFLVHVVYGPQREYAAESKLYITFAETAGEKAVDYYNAYTWNDMLTIDEIMEETFRELEGEGYFSPEQLPADLAGAHLLERREVEESLRADLPSDVRLMRLTFTNREPAVANALMRSLDKALVTYGSRHKETFSSIEILSEEVATLVTYTDRSLAAFVTGAVLGLIGGILLLWMKESLDFAIYVPEEAERRYGIPVIGLSFREERGRQNKKTSAYIALAEKEGEENRRLLPGEPVTLEVGEMPSSEELPLMRESGVLVGLHYGSPEGEQAMHLLSRLSYLQVPIHGLLLLSADGDFLRRYYRYEA